MVQHRWAAALPLLLLLLLAACSQVAEAPGGEEPPDEELLLRQLPFAQVIEGALGLEELEGTGALLRSARGATFRYLGRLIGNLTSAEAPAMALFYEYVPPAGDQDEPPRPSVQMALVSLAPKGEMLYSGPLVLTADGQALLPQQEVEASGLAPFRQNTHHMGVTISVRPALLIDLEGDGVEEIALARRFARDAIAWEEYEVYRRAPEGGRWALVQGDPSQGDVDAPGQAVLDYWARVAAAATIASRWEPETRLRIVWRWLAQEQGGMPPELLLELVPDADPERVRHEQEALTYLRGFFEEAHDHFSRDFKVRQPWPGFVNGFKKTEGVRLLQVSPPSFQPDGEATLTVLVDLTEREGPDTVVRRFQVTTRLVREGEGWFLDGVENTELQEP